MARPSKDRIEDLLKQNKLAGEQQGKFQRLYDILVKNNATAAEFENLLGEILLSIDKIADTADFVQKSFNDTLNENRKIVGSLLKQKKALKGIESIAGKVQSLRMGEGDASEKALAADLQKLIQQKKLLMLAYRGNDIDMAKKNEILKQIQDTNELIDSQEHMLKIAENTKKELGLTGSILSGFENLIDKAGFGKIGVGDAIAETQRLAQLADATGTKFNSLRTFTSILKDNIMSAITPLKILEVVSGLILKTFFEIDKSTGKLAKQLGMSYDEAKAIKKEFTGISGDADNIFITTKSLTATFENLSSRFGVTAGFSEELLKSQTELVKQAGYSEESAAEIAKFSLLTDKTSKDITASALGTVKALNMQEGLTLNEKAILEDVLKTSSAIQLSFNNSVDDLAAAGFEAKKLGLNLDQVDAIAASLLDFESSIASELEAELLLGKNINLEKARQAALDNDLATVAKEVADQVGTSAEFAQMNRIQQEAIAKSVGLSREDLAKSLQEQEAIAKLGGDAASSQEAYNKLVEQGLSDEQIAKKLGDERLASQLKANSVQERFAASVEQAKEVFVEISTVLLPVFNGIANAVASMAKLIPQASTLLGIIASIYSVNLLNTGLNKINALLAKKETQEKVKQQTIAGSILAITGLQNAAMMYQSAVAQGIGKTQALILALEQTKLGAFLRNIGAMTIQLGVQLGLASAALATNAAVTFGVGVAIALAAAAAGFALVKSMTKVDDMLSPGTGMAGYGDRVLTGPEGSFALNNRDTVIAGTNLGGGGNSETNKLLSTLVRQNAKKPEISPVGLYSVQ